MCQRLPCQIVIDKGGRSANTPETHPDKDERRGVHEVHGDDFPGLDSVNLLEPGAIAQRQHVRFVICPALSIVDDERPILGFRIAGMLLQNIEEIDPVGSLRGLGVTSYTEHGRD